MQKKHLLGLSEEGFHKMAYIEWGNRNSSTPIVCVHGLTRNSRDFDYLARHLSLMKRHVFCPDIVGRGDSDWLVNPLHYSYEQYLADLNALISRINADQIDWIGTSMGGLLGMILASLPKNPIRRLVLNDVGPQISTQALARLSAYAGQDPIFSSMEEAKNYFKRICVDVGPLSDNEWQTITENSVQENANGKFVVKLDQKIKFIPSKSKLLWQAILHPQKTLEGTLFDIDLWHIWRNVKCPVLVIHGARSDILTKTTLTKMQQTHPQVEIFTVQDAGHAPALIHNEQIEKIANWLS